MDMNSFENRRPGQNASDLAISAAVRVLIAVMVMAAVWVLIGIMTWTAEPAYAYEGELKFTDENGEEVTWNEWFHIESNDVDKEGFTWNDNGHNHYAVHEGETVEYKRRIKVVNDVVLLLCDGSSLTINGGIEVPEGSSLTIYCQSGKSGKLTINGVAYGNAGIGGNKKENSGTIKIYGGNFDVTGGNDAAGIGGGWQRNCGEILIGGGKIKVSGGINGAGIGNGSDSKFNNGSRVTIRDGEITIAGQGFAAGIGGSERAPGCNVTITGGKVTIELGFWVFELGSENTPQQCIGHGDVGREDDGSSGDLILDDNYNGKHMRVGKIEGEKVSWKNAGERADTCRGTNSVVIENCKHDYDKTGYCKYCGDNSGPILEDISYVDEDGKKMPDDADCDLVTSSTTVLDGSGPSNGWYAVKNRITIHDRITVKGNVNLILCDNAELYSSDGITVASGNSLTIWAQSQDEDSAGRLTIRVETYNCAGIGGDGNDKATRPCGDVTIYGGIIDVKGGLFSAGIGGGESGNGGKIIIGNGVVKATGGFRGAGIGGGDGGHCGSIEIRNGSVEVTGGREATGIGGFSGNFDARLTITGGTVTATAVQTGTHAIGYGTAKTNYYSGDMAFIITGMKVFDSETAAEPVEAKDRIDTFWRGDGATCVIKACDEHVCSYTDNGMGGHKKSCKYCGFEATEDHKWDDATCTSARTCSLCKATEGEPLGHSWKKATCTEPKTCRRCQVTEGEPLGHDWKEATCTEPKTCSVCKATEGEPLGHKWVAATCTEPKTCSVCKATEGEPDPDAHSWGDWKVTKEPGPNSDGTRTRTCSDCGKTETETISASGKLLSKMTSKGNNSLVITWTKMDDAAGYEIYFAQCNHKKKVNICKKIKTVEVGKALKYTKKKLKKNTSYKVFIMSYKEVDGVRVYTDTSLTMHTYTTGGNKKFTNPKKVTVKKSSYTLDAGKTAKISARVTKQKNSKKLKLSNHTATFRYISSLKDVATVDKNGKITAKKPGTCRIYVIASTGVRATVKVTVK